jgi:hypothetical protein
MNDFIIELKRYRRTLPRNILKTIRGQAMAGDLEGARKGLKTALDKYSKR